MGLYCERREGESWRDAVKRIAGKQGLADECLIIFDADVERGTEEAQAAWGALSEWDCLDYRPEK